MQLLAEDFFLLSLGPDGHIRDVYDGTGVGRWIDFDICGALLTELALMGKIGQESDQLKVVNSVPTGDAWLDQTLAAAANAKLTKAGEDWIGTVSNQLNPAGEVATRYAKRGIIRQDQQKKLFGTKRLLVLTNPAPRQQLITGLRIILLGDAIPDARVAMLLHLLDICGQPEDLVSKKESKAYNKRFNSLFPYWRGDKGGGQVVYDGISQPIGDALALLFLGIGSGFSTQGERERGRLRGRMDTIWQALDQLAP